MSCNNIIPLQTVADQVAAILAANYIDKDDPRITNGVFTSPSIRGEFLLDAAAKDVFCNLVQNCVTAAPFGKTWLDRPVYPDAVLVSYEEAGQTKYKWSRDTELVPGKMLLPVPPTADSVAVSYDDAGETKVRWETLKSVVEGNTPLVTDETTRVEPKWAGAVEGRSQADKNKEVVSILDFIPPSEMAAIENRTSSYDVSSALGAAVATGKRVIVPVAGTYNIVGGYSGTTDFDVVATTNGVVFDFNQSAAAYPIENTGAVTLLSNGFTNPKKADISVTFTSVAGIANGDWLCFFCPTDYSYSTWRANYRAGEWVKVRSIVGNVVFFERAFTDSLEGLDLELYRLESVICRIENISLVRTTPNAGVIRFSLSSAASDTNMTADTVTNSVIFYDRCVKPVSNDPKGINKGRGTDDYFLSIGNSQSPRVYGGDIYSRRHAIALGGGNGPCTVPVTDFRCYDSTLNADPAALVGAADMHGNVRDSSYERCTIFAGSNIGGGDNNWYIDCTIYPDIYGRVGFTREMVGGASGWRGSRVHLNGSPRAGSRGFFDVGGNSSGLTDAVKKDVYLQVLDTTIITAINTDTSSIGDTFMLVNVKGCQHNVNVEINRLEALCDVPKLNSLLNIRGYLAVEELGSPDTLVKSKGIIVDNLTNIKSINFINSTDIGVGSYTTPAVPLRLMNQSGVSAGTATAAAEALPDKVNFAIAYPRTPTIQGGLYAIGEASPANAVGGQHIYGLVPIITNSSMWAKLKLPVGSTFTPDEFKLYWTVGMKEL